jgi:hypothetical protein
MDLTRLWVGDSGACKGGPMGAHGGPMGAHGGPMGVAMGVAMGAPGGPWGPMGAHGPCSDVFICKYNLQINL